MEIKFKGMIYPRSVSASVSRESMKVEFPGVKGRATINFRVVESEVSADATLDENLLKGDFSDIDTLGGMVSRAIQLELNILNIVNGTCVEVEIDQFSVSEEWNQINNFVKVIHAREDADGREVKYQSILRLLHRSPIAQVYINPILSDLNRSMRYAEDTGFFCFRAVEVMSKYFCHSMEATVKPRHVTKMLNATGANRSDYDLLKSYADHARHGKIIPISSLVRASLFTAAWDIFDAFIEFANKEFMGIKSSHEKDLEGENIHKSK